MKRTDPMSQQLAYFSILVNDYDEALAFYVGKLGFELVEDTLLSPEKRWVVLIPPGAKETGILLAKASNEEQRATVGKQAGGRVWLFLFTSDFWNDFELYQSRGVEFVRQPVVEKHGTVAVFKDLYGNLWDFIQPSSANSFFHFLQVKRAASI